MGGKRDSQGTFRAEKQSQVPGLSSLAGSSVGSGWEGVEVEIFKFERPNVTPAMSFSELNISVLRSGIGVAWNEHRRDPQFFLRGDAGIVPAGLVHGGHHLEPSAWTSIHLKAPLLAATAEDIVNPDRVEIMPHIGAELQIEALGLALEEEIRTGFASGRLFGEAVGTALAAHLLGHYAVRPAVMPEYRGGMSKYRLRHTVDFIQGNLGRDIGLAELADNAQMSRWHFCRMFKQSTGLSPHQYLLRERIEAAKRLLAKPHPVLAEIAKELGFSDQSHFSTVFRRLIGLTPRQYINSL